MLPKLYRVEHPRTPHLVVFIDPSGRRVRRYFADETEAKAQHRDLLKKAQVSAPSAAAVTAW